MIDLDELERRRMAPRDYAGILPPHSIPDPCVCHAVDDLIAELRVARRVVDAAFTVSCLEILFPYCEDLSLALINYDKVVEGRE